MAVEDWVKVRTTLAQNGKVIRMANAICLATGRDVSRDGHVMRNAVAGALGTAWGLARHNGRRSGKNLVVDGSDVSIVDTQTCLEGLGLAMESVGWIRVSGKTLVFPNFFAEYNADPEEARKEKDRERQRRHRAEKASRDSHAESHTEKRREEKSINSSLPSKNQRRSRSGKSLIGICRPDNHPAFKGFKAKWLSSFEHLKAWHRWQSEQTGGVKLTSTHPESWVKTCTAAIESGGDVAVFASLMTTDKPTFSSASKQAGEQFAKGAA